MRSFSFSPMTDEPHQGYPGSGSLNNLHLVFHMLLVPDTLVTSLAWSAAPDNCSILMKVFLLPMQRLEG